MKCRRCGTKMLLGEGWVPTYNDPDNSGLAPSAEPYCPQCDDHGVGEHEQQLADDMVRYLGIHQV
jgi:hypothetical protein